MQQIDLSTWKRKEHFEFYSQFEEPFFGIVADVDCTQAYRYVKENGISFYAWYMYQSLKVVNEISEFKTRIVNSQPVVYDHVHFAGTTLRDDETFGFTFAEYNAEFSIFEANIKRASESVKKSSGLGLNEDTGRLDVIHYSTLPWVNFTGLTHARCYKFSDSIPKISFGKAIDDKGVLKMPIAINGHHALMDGLHVGYFLDKFQNLLNSKE